MKAIELALMVVVNIIVIDKIYKARDMKAKEFFDLVKRMRHTRKLYEKHNRSDIHREMIKLENEVDREIARADNIVARRKAKGLFG